MPVPPISRSWERYFPDRDPGSVFSIVADIERYPEFVPGCLATRIVHREPSQWTVDNVFGFGPARTRFSSLAKLDPPAVLTIISRDGPWREFRVAWRFSAEKGGCRICCRTHLNFQSVLIATMAAAAAGEIERRIVAAFDNRIRYAAYGDA